MRITIEVAPGELVDRIGILEIKLARITDADKLTKIKNELKALTNAAYRLRDLLEGNRQLEIMRQLDKLTVRLKETNEHIWDIEDRIRTLEFNQDFGQDFIETARSVYHTNDQRAELKKEINELFGSDIAEVKSYSEHTCHG